MKDLFVVKTRGGLLNAYSISNGESCSLLILNKSLCKDHEYYRKYFKADVNLINLKILSLGKLLRYHNFNFEWGCGISDNYLLVMVHILYALFKKDWFKFLSCFAYILNRSITVFPHGCNLYGVDAYKHIKPSYFNNRNYVDNYIVDHKSYINIVSRLFYIEKNKIIVQSYCSNLQSRNVSKESCKKNNIIILMPKVSRISINRFQKFVKFTNNYEYNFYYFVHPNDLNTDLYNDNYFNSPNIFVSSSSYNDFKLINDAKAIIDCGTSLFLITIHFNTELYRYNMTYFQNLLFDNCFKSTSNSTIKLPYFNLKFFFNN